MPHRLLLLAIPWVIGCSAAEAPRNEHGVIAEWHSVSQACRLDPICEDVWVYDNGEGEARFKTTGELSRWKEFAARDRRFTLNSRQREDLVRLLRRAWELKDDTEGRIDYICVLLDPDPLPRTAKTQLTYAAAPGGAWKLDRCMSGYWDYDSGMSPAFRRALESVDAFFRELVWQD